MDEGSGEASELARVVAISVGCLAYINSQQDNNPNNYIFAIYKGKRKGMPFTQHMVRAHLNHLSKTKNIIDEPTGYDKLKNVFGYDSGARITYLTNPYSGGNMRQINGGETGNDSPVGNNSNHFWNATNGWNNQGSLENDTSIDNIQRRHNGDNKWSSSATTMRGHNQKRTIIIDPRAYYGDTQNYTFEVDEIYMASANSVYNYTIYISSGGPEVATDPNHSSWQQLKTRKTYTRWNIRKGISR